MIKLNEDFKPEQKFTRYLTFVSILLTILMGVALTFWIVFLETAVFRILSIICGSLILAVIIFVIIWARLYYKTVVYHLNETEMTWKRGVWFRKTGIVPYNRITNIDIVQGPVMRAFGIHNLQIQTAGYSGNRTTEIAIEGIKDPEPVRQLILSFVRNETSTSAAVCSSYPTSNPSKDSMQKLLEEVAAIRKMLEAKK